MFDVVRYVHLLRIEIALDIFIPTMFLLLSLFQDKFNMLAQPLSEQLFTAEIMMMLLGHQRKYKFPFV